MLRINVLLVVVALLSALGAVSAQHQARKSFQALEYEQARARQLEVEWGQLQLEQSTVATHGRLERAARTRLQMQLPTTAQQIQLEPGAARQTEGNAN